MIHDGGSGRVNNLKGDTKRSLAKFMPEEQVQAISPRQNVFLSFVANLCRSSFE